MSVRSFCRMWSEPMRELDIAVAGALGLAQRLDEGLVADPVQLAGDRLEADVGHRSAPECSSGRARRRRCLRISAGWKRASRSIGAIVSRPVRRHPAGPAELAELRRAGPARSRRPGSPARPPSRAGRRYRRTPRRRAARRGPPRRQEALIYCASRLDEDADPELVLHAVDAARRPACRSPSPLLRRPRRVRSLSLERRARSRRTRRSRPSTPNRPR